MIYQKILKLKYIPRRILSNYEKGLSSAKDALGWELALENSDYALHYSIRKLPVATSELNGPMNKKKSNRFLCNPPINAEFQLSASRTKSEFLLK